MLGAEEYLVMVLIRVRLCYELCKWWLLLTSALCGWYFALFIGWKYLAVFINFVERNYWVERSKWVFKVKIRACWIRQLIKDWKSNLSSLISFLLVIHVFHQNQNMTRVVTLICWWWFRKLKISYTRDFLLSLSGLDICRELPSGFDRSLLR